MENKEIERKFLVNINKLPLNNLQKYYIVQGYVDNELTYRLRKVDFKNLNGKIFKTIYYQTIKNKGTKIRDEYEIELSKEQYNKMWDLCKEITLEKVRYEYPIENNTLFIDIFKNELDGLCVGEVEFETLEECDNFTPPKWLGEEVTNDIRYTNKTLAKMGLPIKKIIKN